MAFDDKELDSFVNGMIKAKNIIYEIKPDMLLAPMMGSVPLFDCLNAIDCGFDNSKVYYVPASSSIDHVKDIISKTVCNILEDQKPDLDALVNGGYKVLGIDEVVSGGSATKVMKGVKSGFMRYANKIAGKETFELRNKLYNKFDYKTIGIEDERLPKAGKVRGSAYIDAVERGEILPVEVERILTMDDPHYCPVRYVTKIGEPPRNYPTVAHKKLIDEPGKPGPYLRFLEKIAVKVGNDPQNAFPKNLARIFEHQKYVPKEYHAPQARCEQAKLEV